MAGDGVWILKVRFMDSSVEEEHNHCCHTLISINERQQGYEATLSSFLFRPCHVRTQPNRMTRIHSMVLWKFESPTSGIETVVLAWRCPFCCSCFENLIHTTTSDNPGNFSSSDIYNRTQSHCIAHRHLVECESFLLLAFILFFVCIETLRRNYTYIPIF